VVALFSQSPLAGGAGKNRRENLMRAIEKFSLFAMSLILCFALATASFGQAVYGSIFGTVTDTSGGIVPGATLTITNINTNLIETTKSNESGG
jgi:hypothetical protein